MKNIFWRICRRRRFNIAIVALISAVSITAAAEETVVVVDGIKYQTLAPDGDAMTVVGIDNAEGEITLKASVNGLDVVAIANSAFYGNTTITAVTIPASIKTIGDAAFREMRNLTSVTLSDGLETIGESAFYTTGLTTLTIPATVTKIGRFAFCYSQLVTANVLCALETVPECMFYECRKLESVHFAYPFKNVGTRAFKYARQLKDFQWPETLVSIGEEAFNSSGLETLVLPESVTDIGPGAFSSCTLTSVTLPSGLKRLEDRVFMHCRLVEFPFSDVLEYIGRSALAGNEFTALNVPGSIKEIGPSAFSSNSYLTEVTLGEGITTLPDELFIYCYKLAKVNFPSTLTTLGSKVFKDCRGITNFVFPASLASVGEELINHGDLDVTYLGATPPDMHYYNDAITGKSATIRIPGEYLGTWQRSSSFKNNLYGMFPLEGWAVADGKLVNAPWYETLIYAAPHALPEQSPINAIGDDAFKACTNLQTLVLVDDITTVGAHAFDSCTGLKELNLPQTFTQMGDGAFSGCSGLESISMITPTEVAIGSGAFDGSACDISVPQNLVAHYQQTYPGYAARFAASAVDYLAYEYDATSHDAIIVANPAYRSYTTVSIPETVMRESERYYVRTVGVDAFKDCTQLTAVLSGTDSEYLMISEIGDGAFKNCTNLSEVKALFGDPRGRIRNIGAEAFSGCTSLKEIPLNGFCEVGDRAFSGCTSLGDLTFGTEAYFTLGNNVFDGCTGITKFVFNRSYPMSIGETAFDGTDCPLYVPDTAVDAYKEAWPRYASRIQGMGKAEDDIFNYSYNADGTATITGFASGISTWDLETLIIPATTVFAGKEYSVTEFEPNGRSDMPEMSEIRLDKIKSIIVNAPLKEFSSVPIFVDEPENWTTLVLPPTLETLKGITILYYQNLGLTELNLPRSLKRIECRFNDSKWAELTIPANVEFICDNAFSNNPALERIEVKAGTPPALGGEQVFANTNDCPIIVPFYAVDAYKAADGWRVYADRIVSNLDVPSDFPLSEDNKTMAVGDKHKLRVVDWESSDLDVVTVDEDGNLSAVGQGDALITARTLDGRLQSSCFVTVEENTSTGIETPVVDVDTDPIVSVYNINGVQVLGEGADADDLRRLTPGIYVVRTARRSYKIKL